VILATVFHPEARAEFLAATRWYGDRQAGLGIQLNTAVQDTVDSIVSWPESAPIWPGWNRLPVVRAVHLPDHWPYRIVYFVDDTTLWVIAVAPDKRLPEYWKSRVTSS